MLNWWNQFGFDEYEALNEGLVPPDDQDGLVPDVVFYDARTMDPVVTVEITRSGRKKVKEAEGHVFGHFDGGSVREAFIFIYETGEWRRYVSEDRYEAGISGSDVLGIDLADFLELP